MVGVAGGASVIGPAAGLDAYPVPPAAVMEQGYANGQGRGRAASQGGVTVRCEALRMAGKHIRGIVR